jgi:hypothetical protein
MQKNKLLLNRVNNLLKQKLEQVDDYMKPNAVWDRGKEPLKAYESIKQLQNQLESLESCLSLEHQRKSPASKSINILNAYLLNSEENNSDDIDLESLDSKSIKLNNSANGEIKLSNESNSINDSVETASLSNFHNVRDVLSTIKLRLEQCLKTNQDNISGSSRGLEEYIGELTTELEYYVKRLNDRKEYELRKFSQNMSSQTNLVHMKNAFLKKELHSNSQSFIYDTLVSCDEYSHYSNDSIQNYRDNTLDGFFMRNCYDEVSSFENNFDTHSVEYYSMLINEEVPDSLLNAAPTLLPRYQERERISLIFQTPDNNVIKEWQKYQLNTITIKPKKNKYSKGKAHRQQEKKRKSYDIWSFTLDYHKTRKLQLKLEKERKIRLICRIFFYFFGLACFIFVVFFVQSFFNNKQSKQQ